MPNQDSPIRRLRPGKTTTALPGAAPAPAADESVPAADAAPDASRADDRDRAAHDTEALDARESLVSERSTREIAGDDARGHPAGPDDPAGTAGEGAGKSEF